MQLTIAGRIISSAQRPFVVAELSGNHDQSFERAMALVEAAAQAGADAIKLQTYTADTMTLDLAEREFLIDDPNSLWKGYSLYDLYKKASTPWEWHAPLFQHAQKLGMLAFSTPFDATATDFLETLNVPCYKIAAFENTDIPLIRRVAATGKPLLLSTGMADAAELTETIAAARAAGCNAIALLKCTSTYPADAAFSNLRTIPFLREQFGCVTGISDHTPGVGVAAAAVALGACIIEKHLTLRHDDGSVDSKFSLEPAEFAALVTATGQAHQALGQVYLGATPAERSSLRYRRSLYITADMSAGETLTPSNVRAIRPGLGLPPKELGLVLGRQLRCAVTRGTPLTWEMLSPRLQEPES